MVKAIFINGLRRSGTTMLERLVDSQPGMICFGHLFDPMAVVEELTGLPAKDLLMRENFESGALALSGWPEDALRLNLYCQLFEQYASLTMHRYFSVVEQDDFYGLDKAAVWEIAEMIVSLQSVTDIPALLCDIGSRLDKRVVGTKWTHAHGFAPIMLKNENAYWIEIVRSPYAVYSSETLGGWGLSWEMYRNKNHALKFSATYTHPRFRRIHYEDLVSDPVKCLKELSDWIGEDFSNVAMKNPRGGAFRGNSSVNVVEAGNRDYEAPEAPATVDPTRLGGWRKRLTSTDIAFINMVQDFYGLYPKEKVAPAALFGAVLKFARVYGYYAVKRGVNALVAPFGLKLQKKNPFER